MNPHVTLQTLRRQRQVYRQELDRIGRPLPSDVPLRREVYVGDTPEQAYREAERIFMPLYTDLLHKGQNARMPAGERMDGSFDELRRDRFIIGGAEDVREELGRYERELGITDMIVRLDYPGLGVAEAVRHIHAFGERIIARY
jgi:alkanesulfonate monooxygenase SsuD/methylene tetrahydromethanopterin reductase-like flavin-dependent oxidoreductase (luciferase family)